MPPVRRRAGAVLAAAALAGAAAPASAQALPTLHHGDRGRSVERLQHGLHIAADGVFGRGTVRAVKRFQRRHGLKPDGVVGSRTRRALGLPATSAPRSAVKGTSVAAPSGTLTRIAECESGGDPTAVSADGRYRGKYQFDRGTWRALGGSGDPAGAPEAEQDQRAAALLARSGTAPWPSCAA